MLIAAALVEGVALLRYSHHKLNKIINIVVTVGCNNV
jgi:hypothetical protein